MTKIIKIDPFNIDETRLMSAADIIKHGGLCAFPTETVYGLGANAYNGKAVSKIFKSKGRPQDNPLIVHIAEMEDVNPLVRDISPSAYRLMERFWGGPLTLVMKKSSKVPPQVTAGLDTVGVRLVSHPVSNALIRLAGVPIAAPSANISGKPSPTIAQHVIDDLYGKVDCIIDGGSSLYGIESTVLDLSVKPYTLLRPGAVTTEEIEEIIGPVTRRPKEGAPKSPGMKYTHYAPKAPLYAVEIEHIKKIAKTHDKKTGILGYALATSEGDIILPAGKNIKEYAACLFYNLREFDKRGADVIYAVLPPPGGMGDAVRNRILKAAGGKTIGEDE